MTGSSGGSSAFWKMAVLVVFIGLLCAILLIMNTNSGDPSDIPTLGEVPEFALTNQSGVTVTQEVFRGGISVVDFIFTSCTSICPVMSGRMAYLQEILDDRERIRFVSVSVDPERDTPAVLTEYAERYGADPWRWTFLTGDRAVIYDLTRRGFHLGLETEGSEEIIHSQKFVLVDGELRIRGYYDSEDDDAMHRLVEDAETLSQEISR